MKKFKTMMAVIVALVSMCVTFSSCSKDDNSSSQSTAQQLAGTYTGSLAMSANGQDMGTDENKTLKVEANGNVQATVTLPECGSGKMTLPALEVKDVLVTTAAGIPTMEVSNYKGTASNGKAYTVDLKGTYSNKKLTVTYSVTYGTMPMTINFTFTSSSKN